MNMTQRIMTLGDLARSEREEAAARAKSYTDEAEQRRARLESDASWLIGFHRGDLAREDVAELTADILAQLDACTLGRTIAPTANVSDDQATEGGETT
jgi:hypothetical protein